MSPLIELLHTVDLGEQPTVGGRYDEERGLRLRNDGRPVIEIASNETATETRSGRDRDEDRSLEGLGTHTKSMGDRDEATSLTVTKTGAGRDLDEEQRYALASTITLSGPDRD